MPDVSKIIYEGQTLIDLTSDTVNEGNLLQGYTAHSRDGRIITGEMEIYEGEKISPAFTVNNEEVLVIVIGTGNEDQIIFEIEGANNG